MRDAVCFLLGSFGSFRVITAACGGVQNLASPWERGGSLALEEGFSAAWRNCAHHELCTSPAFSLALTWVNSTQARSHGGESTALQLRKQSLLSAPPFPPDDPVQDAWFCASVSISVKWASSCPSGKLSDTTEKHCKYYHMGIALERGQGERGR